jgi:hypothetical protein
MSPRIPKNNINMYTLCLMKEGNDGGYTWHINLQIIKAWQMIKK